MCRVLVSAVSLARYCSAKEIEFNICNSRIECYALGFKFRLRKRDELHLQLKQWCEVCAYNYAKWSLMTAQQLYLQITNLHIQHYYCCSPLRYHSSRWTLTFQRCHNYSENLNNTCFNVCTIPGHHILTFSRLYCHCL